MKPIFDDRQRTDESPGYDTEDSFRFLNRVAGPAWAKVRDLTEEWFADYPASEQAELRSRFREPAAAQHYGAGWELYVYTLYRRLGYEVTIHPTLPNTARRPDFLVTRGDVSTYVECIVHLSTGGRSSGRGNGGEPSWIFEATNRARDPNFMVNIEIIQAGSERPRAADIIGPLEEWLSTLDPDEVSRQVEVGSGPPNLVLAVRGWIIEYDAWPVKPERRGERGRLIGAYPAVSASISNETLRLRDLLKFKGGRYGTPDRPLVIAFLNTSGFTEEPEMTEALFGTEAFEYTPGQTDSGRMVRQRDGYWRQGPPKRGSRVSAVLFGQNIYPWRIIGEMPSLWLNPWADKPLNDSLPLRTLTAYDTGHVHQVQDGTMSPEELFELPTDWPGFTR